MMKHMIPHHNNNNNSSSHSSSAEGTSHHHPPSSSGSSNLASPSSAKITDGPLFYLRRKLLGGSANTTIPFPPPPPKIQPGYGGPIHHPNANDVLCGRGGKVNSHSGNIRFRQIVAEWKPHYLDKANKKVVKAHIVAQIVNVVRAQKPPGRFLKLDDKTGLWLDVGDEKARKKAGQALREADHHHHIQQQGVSAGSDHNITDGTNGSSDRVCSSSDLSPPGSPSSPASGSGSSSSKSHKKNKDHRTKHSSHAVPCLGYKHLAKKVAHAVKSDHIASDKSIPLTPVMESSPTVVMMTSENVRNMTTGTTGGNYYAVQQRGNSRGALSVPSGLGGGGGGGQQQQQQHQQQLYQSSTDFMSRPRLTASGRASSDRRMNNNDGRQRNHRYYMSGSSVISSLSTFSKMSLHDSELFEPLPVTSAVEQQQQQEQQQQPTGGRSKSNRKSSLSSSADRRAHFVSQRNEFKNESSLSMFSFEEHKQQHQEEEEYNPHGSSTDDFPVVPVSPPTMGNGNAMKFRRTFSDDTSLCRSTTSFQLIDQDLQSIGTISVGALQSLNGGSSSDAKNPKLLSTSLTTAGTGENSVSTFPLEIPRGGGGGGCGGGIVFPPPVHHHATNAAAHAPLFIQAWRKKLMKSMSTSGSSTNHGDNKNRGGFVIDNLPPVILDPRTVFERRRSTSSIPNVNNNNNNVDPSYYMSTTNAWNLKSQAAAATNFASGATAMDNCMNWNMNNMSNNRGAVVIGGGPHHPQQQQQQQLPPVGYGGGSNGSNSNKLRTIESFGEEHTAKNSSCSSTDDSNELSPHLFYDGAAGAGGGLTISEQQHEFNRRRNRSARSNAGSSIVGLVDEKRARHQYLDTY